MRRVDRFRDATFHTISIHAFRRECDPSPLPVADASVLISIHAFRRECDNNGTTFATDDSDFNPRIPQGMRQSVSDLLWSMTDFNPRIPQGMRPVKK